MLFSLLYTLRASVTCCWRHFTIPCHLHAVGVLPVGMHTIDLTNLQQFVIPSSDLKYKGRFHWPCLSSCNHSFESILDKQPENLSSTGAFPTS